MTSNSEPLGVRYGPHVVMMSVGFVLFSYASVPTQIMSRYDVGFTEVGLLMSAAMGAFMVVQVIGGRLVDNRSTSRVLLYLALAHATVAVLLDLMPTYLSLLGLRLVWGCLGGLILTVGAAHIARVYVGTIVTRHHGIFGAMITLGGTFAFLITPIVVATTGGIGMHAVGGLLAIPAILMLWTIRDHSVLSGPNRDPDTSTHASGGDKRTPTWNILTNRIVILAAIGYVAILSAYITLSTFITAYFDEIGIVGPLNALALFVATIGRVTGGLAVARPGLNDGKLLAIMCALGTIGFGLLVLGSGIWLVLLPIFILAAISVPFGAVIKVTATATTRDATALAVVIAAGNFAALVLPALTGYIRDITGEYTLAFLIMAGLNALAIIAGIAIARRF